LVTKRARRLHEHEAKTNFNVNATMSIYADWSFNSERRVVTRPKTDVEAARHEVRRRTMAMELVANVDAGLKANLPPLSASEARSMVFRERGVPSLDSFTAHLVGCFRAGVNHSADVRGLTRAFLPLKRWASPEAVMTMWTVEPVVATMIVRGNSVNVARVKTTYEEELVVIDPMSMTTHATTVTPGNEIRGRWAGWLVWRSTLDSGPNDAMCLSCNLCSTTIMFAVHSVGTSLVHLVMTPESVTMVGTYARVMAADLGVTVSMPTLSSTKLVIQPVTSTGRSTSAKIFGNGSLQVTGHPSDIENLVRAAFSFVNRVVEAETFVFMKTLRVANRPVV
jgi:hypothetical protein